MRCSRREWILRPPWPSASLPSPRSCSRWRPHRARGGGARPARAVLRVGRARARDSSRTSRSTALTFTAGVATVEVLIDGASVLQRVDRRRGRLHRARRRAVPVARRAPVHARRCATGSNWLAAQSRVTNLAVNVRPRRAPPSRRVRFRGRGFMQTGPGLRALPVRRQAPEDRSARARVDRARAGPSASSGGRSRSRTRAPAAGRCRSTRSRPTTRSRTRCGSGCRSTSPRRSAVL